jgi:DNA-binding MarR family transcriptional regulator
MRGQEDIYLGYHSYVDDRRLVNLLGVTALAAVDRLRPAVDAEAGHSGGAAGALVHLQAWPGESVEGLRRVLGISQPATVRTVNRLVADRLLQRRPGPDRRTTALFLTDAGQAAAERICDARAAALQDFLAPLDDGERARLLALLERLAASLAGDRPAGLRVCRLCDRGDCCRTAPCPLQHTVPA